MPRRLRLALVASAGAVLAVCSAAGCSAFQAPSSDAGATQPIGPLAPAQLAVGDALGTAVAASAAGDLVAVGAPGDDRAAPNAGAVYLFMADASGSFTAAGVLTESAPHDGDAFGAGLALSGAGDLLAVGVTGADLASAPGGGSDAGAVDLYQPAAGSWQLVTRINAPQPLPGAHFGASISFVGTDHLVVGAPGDSHAGPSTGAAYLFVRQSTGWAPL